MIIIHDGTSINWLASIISTAIIGFVLLVLIGWPLLRLRRWLARRREQARGMQSPTLPTWVPTPGASQPPPQAQPPPSSILGPPPDARPPSGQPPAPPAFNPGRLSRPQVIQGSTYLQNGPRSHLDTFRQGREGEEQVVQRLQSGLDGRWTLLRNVVLPGSKADLDIVLVGPGGIFAFEVKTFTGAHRVEGGRWYRETSNGYWARNRHGPGAQARDNAARLSEFLGDQGITKGRYVEPIVVLGQDVTLDVVSAKTTIWRWQDVDVRVADIARRSKHTDAHVAQVVEILRFATLAGATPHQQA